MVFLDKEFAQPTGLGAAYSPVSGETNTSLHTQQKGWGYSEEFSKISFPTKKLTGLLSRITGRLF